MQSISKTFRCPPRRLTRSSKFSRSPTFDRSERLHKFLRYICKLTLKGEASRINEYLIGSEVFRRVPTTIPTKIRWSAAKLMRCGESLNDYYAGEGKDRPIRIELARWDGMSPRFDGAKSRQLPSVPHPRRKRLRGCA